MDHNDARMPLQLPPLFSATPQSLLQDAEGIITNVQDVWDQIIAEVTPENAAIENVILPVAHSENDTKLHADIIYFLATVHPDTETREAAKDARRLMTEAEIDLYLRVDMFRLVDGVLNKTDEAETEAEAYRFLLKQHAQRNGCDLEGPAKDQFEGDNKRFNSLINEYKSNLDNDRAGMWVTRADLDGLPTDFIDALRRGESENQGMVWVNMKRPHWSRVLKYAKSEDTRRRYFIQHLNRVPANVPLHREIILLRDSLARQKGWKSWAYLKMSEKMMKSPETVMTMLAEMHPRLYEKGVCEAKELLALKQADVHNPETRLFLWDHAFYENKRHEKLASFDAKLAMEYFEVKSVVKHILSLYERLFDIKFELVTQERSEQLRGGRSGQTTWQKDVFFYIVWDEGNKGSFLGYIYFDLHPRPGKYTHAGHYNLQKV